MIKVEDLTKKYGEVRALDGVSFEMKEGEVVGVLGPNGAGKTTLLRILVTFLKPDGGEVLIDGFDISDFANHEKIKSKIGYLPEHAPLYEDLTVREYLEFVGKMQGIAEDDLNEKVTYVLNKCGLKEKKNSEISTLSKGYRQRTGIAQSLIHDPKIVILDEPTTGLDPNQRIEIRDLIKEIGKLKTVILSSHVLSEVQATCSRVLIINKGRIVADGAPEDLVSEEKGKATINIEVEKITSDLIAKIKALGGVKEVKAEGNKIAVITGVENDIRKDVASLVVEEGAGLLEFVHKQVDLEDVFINLTKN
ncbi:ATP-binding cassette domain-containing protein [Patescibacteria group bacterium]|nr:ATP-binding cassette domain-containing protein [Patescibacteria group bacterium]MBU4580684.1 ATP-binding cassette domain-containing protein [Patescibacteria group bacterium]